MTEERDEQLVLQAQAGDKRAQNEIMYRHAGLVKSLARRFFLVGGETEDLIQEGMMGLFCAIGDYQHREDGKSFKNFAYMCVRNRIIDAVKKATSKKSVFLSESVALQEGKDLECFHDPAEEMILRDESRELTQMMSRELSNLEFKIMTMYMEGMSCAEICEATGKDRKGVDNAIQRSRRKLQRVLKK